MKVLGNKNKINAKIMLSDWKTTLSGQKSRWSLFGRVRSGYPTALSLFIIKTYMHCQANHGKILTYYYHFTLFYILSLSTPLYIYLFPFFYFLLNTFTIDIHYPDRKGVKIDISIVITRNYVKIYRVTVP